MRTSAVERAGPSVLALLARLEGALRERLAKGGDRLHRAVMQDWIAYRGAATGLVFAEVRPRRGHAEVFVLPPPSALGPLGGRVHPMPKSRGWGWFRSRFVLRPEGDLDVALRLMEASHAFSSRRSRALPSAQKRVPRGGGRVRARPFRRE